jgi:rhamnose utilization protein RhaD (predicted bifunctional aldolase and dehydrogenase)
MDVNISELSKSLTLIDGAYIPKADVIHSLAIDPWSLELALRNPAYPDHVVFCGIRPWVMSIAEMPPSHDTKYGLIPGVGVFLLPAATAATEAMLQAQAEILLRIPPGEETNLLSDYQCDELLDWEAEKYRQNLVKTA